MGEGERGVEKGGEEGDGGSGMGGEGEELRGALAWSLGRTESCQQGGKSRTVRSEVKLDGRAGGRGRGEGLERKHVKE